MEPSGRSRLALAADVLTITRLGFAFLLVPLVWQERLDLAAVVLSLAWLSDLFDGRLARMAGTPTRFGRWDLRVDTGVGVALVIGLIGNGTVSLWFGLAALVVLGGFFLAGNIAASMLLQLSGYLPLLYTLWQERPDLWWLPFATFSAIGLADWRRLIRVTIPAFLHGMAGRFERYLSP